MGARHKVAVIGIGFMGSMHAAIFARELRAELVAVVDKNFDLARSVAARFPGTKAYASQDKLIAAERLDLVSICTPDHLHLEPALAIAEKGINLFIEKPIASRLEEGEAIVAAVRKAGVKLGIGHLLRFDPRYSAARELIRSAKSAIQSTCTPAATARGPKAQSVMSEPCRSRSMLPCMMWISCSGCSKARSR